MSVQQDSEQYEATHVHHVYERIASNFSDTRYKPWPLIERFLHGLPDGAVGLDVGCGNGKYLAVNKNVFIIASDRSHNLATIATRHQPHSVLVADILGLPHAQARYDFVISIAVVHHLSTSERRIEAVRALLEPLNDQGRVLVYVWALEQGNSRRGWTDLDSQDQMVPWVLRRSNKGESNDEAAVAQTFYRYYHLYRQGELEEDIRAAGGEVIEAGYEKDNWWVIARRA